MTPAPQPTAVTQTRVAAATPARTGGFIVQVSSQRSRKQAQASYAGMQRKFPGVLRNIPPLIQKAIWVIVESTIVFVLGRTNGKLPQTYVTDLRPRAVNVSFVVSDPPELQRFT